MMVSHVETFYICTFLMVALIDFSLGFFATFCLLGFFRVFLDACSFKSEIKLFCVSRIIGKLPFIT